MTAQEQRARRSALWRDRYHADPVFRALELARRVAYDKRRYLSDPIYRARKIAAARLRSALARTHPEIREAKRRNASAWRVANPLRAAWTGYQKQARRAGRRFMLAPILFEDLVTDRCFYCGTRPTTLNGIDRVDNAQGYIEGNVVACCRWCNNAKMNRPRHEFESWVLGAARYMQRQGALA